VGVAQLAIQYCNTMINTPALQAKMFPGGPFTANQFATPNGINAVTGPLAAAAVGNGALKSQPPASAVSGELNNLIGILCTGATPCNTLARVQAVASAACAAAFGNAVTSIN
jgi:hypothetical protein